MQMLERIKTTFGWGKKKHVTKITLGICAMDRKAKSKPMREILQRLPEELFEIIVFGDEVILEKPIEQWPIVEALISFYSSKFPTHKASEYIKLRKPFIFNDLDMEANLKDRRKVYEMLKSQNIEVPFHVFLSREDPEVVNVVEEFDEYVVINGVHINKPLVEKPVDAEDHNIYIYYPMSAGGGSKRLFRKVKDRSSEFYPHINELRTEGSYIYEEFVHTQGTDVKVYTVGPDYGHAEARKSPVVDGKVNRDSLGYEVRYPVILSPYEKDMARKIVVTFRQTVCGFDILRVQGKSYVCDVNGFSFVKNSRKYYDDASQILMEIMLNELRPELHATMSTRAPLLLQRERQTNNQLRRPSFSSDTNSNADQYSSGEEFTAASNNMPYFGSDNSLISSDPPSTSKKSKYSVDQEELRCIIAVIRHGDRTPKQKMKVKVADPKYLAYFNSYTKSPYKDLKVKSKSALVKFLDITREILASGSVTVDNPLLRKLRQIKDVLERWEISGINRKLQMKPQKWNIDPSDQNSDSADTSKVEVTELLVILKWGGDLTPLGRVQAEKVGTMFRHNLYPDTEGGGVLRLHSTYRHDLKIKASDEGRVMKTAAAFTKGLLELEGQLTPILASLVTVEEKNRQMLDRGGNNEVRGDMDHCKKHLDKLQTDEEMTSELCSVIAPGAPFAITQALMNLKNPLKTLHRIYALIESLCTQLEDLSKEYSDTESSPSPAPFDYDMHNVGIQASPSRENIVISRQEATDSGDDSPAKRKTSISPEEPIILPSVPSNQLHNKDENILEAAELLSASWPSSKDLPPLPIIKSVSESNLPALPINHSIPTRTASDSFAGSQSGMSYRSNELELKSVDDGLYLSETFTLMSDRWSKLHKDFFSSDTKMFDLTKVPDVYDMIRYDCLHNHHLHLEGMEELFELSQLFENAVVPQEYGIDHDEKRRIGSKMCGALLEKIKRDLQVVNSDQPHEMTYSLDHSHAADLAINSLGRLVRTRLYFTSESHLHTLLNVLRYPAEGSPCAFSPEGLNNLDHINELSYLTQVVIRLFEDRIDPSKFRCELCLSPGAISNPLTDKNGEIAPYVLLNKSISYDDLMDCLGHAIEAGRTPACESDISEDLNGDHGKDHIDDELADVVVESGELLKEGSGSDKINSKRTKSTEKFDITGIHPLKRNESITVVTNSSLENYDRWEISDGVAKTGKEKNKNSKRSGYMREVGPAATLRGLNMALKTTVRPQSPVPAMPLPAPTTNLPKEPSSGLGIAERDGI